METGDRHLCRKVEDITLYWYTPDKVRPTAKIREDAWVCDATRHRAVALSCSVAFASIATEDEGPARMKIERTTF
jgi:hypothetical protein